MNLKQQENAIRLFALIAVGVALLIILFMPRDTYAQSMAKEHAKLQKELCFQTWQSKQGKTRIQAAKQAVKQSKEANKSAKQSDRINRKEDRILAKIEG